jgi:hypothetical protein
MDARYQSSISPNATERITATYPDGTRKQAESVLEGEIVGRRCWDTDGSLMMETPLQNGVKHGIEYTFYANGNLVAAEPYWEGQMHGLTEQWDRDGRLIGSYTMVHGTGIDLWRAGCFSEDGSVVLSEAATTRTANAMGSSGGSTAISAASGRSSTSKRGGPTASTGIGIGAVICAGDSRSITWTGSKSPSGSIWRRVGRTPRCHPLAPRRTSRHGRFRRRFSGHWDRSSE